MLMKAFASFAFFAVSFCSELKAQRESIASPVERQQLIFALLTACFLTGCEQE